MSTLEKIRKRPAIVISVIGFAIVLFIVTAVVTNFNIFSDHETAVSVNGDKIKYAEVADYSQAINGNEATKPNAIEASMNEMINNKLIEQAAEEIGLTVTDKEMEAYLFGEIPPREFSQLLQELAQYPELGITDMKSLYAYVTSGTDEAKAMKPAFDAADREARANLLRYKYFTQIAAVTNVNRADAQKYYNDNQRSATIRYVVKDFNSLPDKDFAVTADELADLYKAEKERFKINGEQRLVSYIVVVPELSAEDKAATRSLIQNTINDLRAPESGTKAIDSNLDFQSVPAEALSGSVETITTNLNQVFGQSLPGASMKVPVYINSIINEPTGVALLDKVEDTYIIGKLLDSDVDSEFANYDMIAVSKEKADAVLEQLNGGIEADSIADGIIEKHLGEKIPAKMLSDNTQPQLAELKKKFDENGNSYFKFNPMGENDEMELLFRFNEYTEPTDIYQLAIAIYTDKPSSATVAKAESDFRNFVENNMKYADFKANAKEAGYKVENVRIDGSNLSIANLPDTSAAAFWAMDNDKGDVSPVYSNDDRTAFVAVAIADIYDNGYLGANDPEVKKYLAAKVRADKKAEKLLGQYKGKAKDIDGYATAMETMVQNAPNVSYAGRSNIGGIAPNDPYFYSQFAVAKKGDVVGPFKTKNGIVVFEIVDEQSTPREFEYDTDKNAASSILSIPNPYEMLRANKKISYDIQRFFGGER